MSHSPWGSIQQCIPIQYGVRWVSTASHGGLMVTADVAAKQLSQRAIDLAHPGVCGDHVCFEEDCSYAIAFFEHPEWAVILEVNDKDGRRDIPTIKDNMAHIIEQWVPEYFCTMEAMVERAKANPDYLIYRIGQYAASGGEAI